MPESDRPAPTTASRSIPVGGSRFYDRVRGRAPAREGNRERREARPPAVRSSPSGQKSTRGKSPRASKPPPIPPVQAARPTAKIPLSSSSAPCAPRPATGPSQWGTRHLTIPAGSLPNVRSLEDLLRVLVGLSLGRPVLVTEVHATQDAMGWQFWISTSSVEEGSAPAAALQATAARVDASLEDEVRAVSGYIPMNNTLRMKFLRGPSGSQVASSSSSASTASLNPETAPLVSPVSPPSADGPTTSKHRPGQAARLRARRGEAEQRGQPAGRSLAARLTRPLAGPFAPSFSSAH
ncbi:hypothetical protein HGRIS_006514 [Hohenbuehelia grisea]|uniref:Uncharacterized protein n=1 Tax=Hohenbuehelia grisea TaxID=104357 RepID=A0ABR3J9A2_9AGAR